MLDNRKPVDNIYMDFANIKYIQMAAVYRRQHPPTISNWWFNQVQIIISPRLYDLGHEEQLKDDSQNSKRGANYKKWTCYNVRQKIQSNSENFVDFLKPKS